MKMNTCKDQLENVELRQVKSNIFKALAHPTRLWMVEQLIVSEHCVCNFVDQSQVDFSTISKHLSILKNAGIVADGKRGKQVFYRLIMPCVVNMIDCIEGVVCHRYPRLINDDRSLKIDSPDNKQGEPS